MPSFRAVAITFGIPTAWPSCAATVLIESAKAVRRSTRPRNRESSFWGDQSPIVTGWSTIVLSGVKSRWKAAR